jgi:hypothetical protein
MALVPPGHERPADSSAGHGRHDHRKYGSIWRADMDVAKRRFWLVSTGLVTFIVFAAVAQIASNEWNETASLNEATQLWDMSNKITSEEMKHAIKSELSSTFQKENENLQTALAISNDPSDDLLHSSSNDRRHVLILDFSRSANSFGGFVLI